MLWPVPHATSLCPPPLLSSLAWLFPGPMIRNSIDTSSTLKSSLCQTSLTVATIPLTFNFGNAKNLPQTPQNNLPSILLHQYYHTNVSNLSLACGTLGVAYALRAPLCAITQDPLPCKLALHLHMDNKFWLNNQPLSRLLLSIASN